MRFRYLRDPLFVFACLAYAANRWLLKPLFPSSFLHSWFNDLLLVPCAIPVLYWIFRRLHLRRDDSPPPLLELIGIVTVWSVLFEWAGPVIIPGTTADWRDVVMYFSGGAVAWIFWQMRARRAFAP